MSDSAQAIVDIDISAAEAPALAEFVRAWLIEEAIVERDRTDSGLSAAGAHRPGRNYRAAIASDEEFFLELTTNGVEIIVGRTAFDAGENGIELRCAACGSSFTPDEPWYEAVGAWFNGDDLASFACPSCGHRAPLAEWRGRWPWGLGNLGLQFWNWPPLAESFIASVSRKLGHRTVLVHRHL